MELVSPYFEFWGPITKDNYLLQLERCARTCYKSEDKICDGSAEKLLSRVVKDLGHVSVVEHANVVLKLSHPSRDEVLLDWISKVPMFGHRFTLLENSWEWLMSGNLRMWLEWQATLPSILCNFSQNILSCLNQQWPFFFPVNYTPWKTCAEVVGDDPKTISLTPEQRDRHCMLTGKFVMNRAISHQLVRHRLMSFSQESSRYCDYSKKGVRFIRPLWFDKDGREVIENRIDYESMCEDAENDYNFLRECGMKPEDARDLLSHALATEIVVSGTIDQWKHLKKMRADNNHAQEMIRVLCKDAWEKIEEYLK